MDLHDRRVLITGGSSGIGLELARRLARDNHVVVAARDIAGLEEAVAAGPRLHAAQLDVTSEEQSRAALADAVAWLGGLDLLVNSAGILRRVVLSDPTAAAAVEAEIAVNLVGSMRMTRLALPYLQRADEGAVVFLSSALALTAAPGLASYAATKAAVHSFARSLRAELADQVKVFDVLPPFVDTGLAAGLSGPKLQADAVAADIVEGLRRERLEIRIGRVNALAWMARIWPQLGIGSSLASSDARSPRRRREPSHDRRGDPRGPGLPSWSSRSSTCSSSWPRSTTRDRPSSPRKMLGPLPRSRRAMASDIESGTNPISRGCRGPPVGMSRS